MYQNLRIYKETINGQKCTECQEIMLGLMNCVAKALNVENAERCSPYLKFPFSCLTKQKGSNILLLILADVGRNDFLLWLSDWYRKSANFTLQSLVRAEFFLPKIIGNVISNSSKYKNVRLCKYSDLMQPKLMRLLY